MALLISIGNMGGAIGINIFLEAQKPRYWLGYRMGMGLTFAAIVSTFILRFAYSQTNKKRDRMSEEEIRAKYTEDEMLGKSSVPTEISPNEYRYGRQKPPSTDM